MMLHAKGQAAIEFKLARKALDKEDFEEALAHFEIALELRDDPCWYSYVGYCIVKSRGDFRNGVALCMTALEMEPENPVHYLNLGKVYLASGNKEKARLAFLDGLEKGGNVEILRMLVDFGNRNAPIIKSLSRSNPLNKFLGNLIHRHNLRKHGLP